MTNLLKKLKEESERLMSEKYDSIMYEAIHNIMNNSPKIYLIKDLFNSNNVRLIIESPNVPDKIDINVHDGIFFKLYNRMIKNKDSQIYYNLMDLSALNKVFSIIEDIKGDTIENLSGALLHYIED
jgi:hypothetical protein